MPRTKYMEKQQRKASPLFLERENEWLIIAVILAPVSLLLDLRLLDLLGLFGILLLFRLLSLGFIHIATSLFRNNTLHVQILIMLYLTLHRLRRRTCLLLLHRGRRRLRRCLGRISGIGHGGSRDLGL